MAVGQIKAEEKAIHDVLGEKYIFQIPRYQRPYSWETEEANILLSDLMQVIKDSVEPVKSLDEYFLGSIVLIKSDSQDAKVVDGQQRLTTLTILFSVLRYLLLESEQLDDRQDLADNITHLLYDKGNKLLGTPNRYRLILRNKDSAFFQKYIQDSGGIEKLTVLNTHLSDSQNLIKNNALHFLEKLRIEKQTDVNMLVRLASYIMRKCVLVVVATPNNDSAYRIFSVMNDRGKNLTTSDILKAEIIGKVAQDAEEPYTDKWEDIEEDLGRDTFEDLFARIRMICMEARARKSILNEIRDKIKPSEKPTVFIDETLIPFSKAFKVLKNASYSSTLKSSEINKCIEWLQLIDNADWQAPAILYLANHFDEPKSIYDFLIHLDKLAMGLMIN